MFSLRVRECMFYSTILRSQNLVVCARIMVEMGSHPQTRFVRTLSERDCVRQRERERERETHTHTHTHTQIHVEEEDIEREKGERDRERREKGRKRVRDHTTRTCLSVCARACVRVCSALSHHGQILHSQIPKTTQPQK